MACGYKNAYSIEDIAELEQILKTFRDKKGPILLEIKVNLASRDDLGRPSRTTYENKEDFMKYLEK